MTDRPEHDIIAKYGLDNPAAADFYALFEKNQPSATGENYSWADRHKKKSEPAASAAPTTGNGASSQYGKAALEAELTTLQDTPEGQRNDQLNKSAFALAQLVAAGHLSDQDTRQQLHRAALAIGLERAEINATIRSGFAAGLQQPRQVAPLEPTVAITAQQNERGVDPTTGETTDGDPYEDGKTTERSSWWPRDLSTVLDGNWTPPEPTVGLRDDGIGLFYSGKTHSLIGESEAAKGWLMLLASIDEMKNGNHILYIDFEDSEGSVAGRLMTMAVRRERIAEQFHYIRPEAPLDNQGRWDVAEVLMDTKPTLAVVDGVTEAMTLHGLNPLDNADIAKFNARVTKRLADSGPAAVAIDHVVKNSDSRGRYALGGVHKLNALSGAGYLLQNVAPFGIGLHGRSRLYIAKDRPGQLRAHGLSGDSGMHWFGDLTMKPTQGTDLVELRIWPPKEQSDTTFRPTFMMVRISELLADKGPLAQRVICDLVKGKTETKRTALSHLIGDGYVTAKTPHANIKPFVVESS